MKNESILKLLYLLNLLCKKEYSKNEIIEEFKKQNIVISKTSVDNYIKKIKLHDIEIKEKQIKHKKYYSLDNKNLSLSINKEEMNTIKDVKRLILNEKNVDNIRYMMRAFYKFALMTKTKKIRSELADFGYYSKINWTLVKALQQHCKEKNIITIDYSLANGKNKYITIHTDSIKAGNWSDRIYLNGIIKNDNKISQLPVDKIYMIKKINKKNVRFDINVDVLTYKISKQAYKNTDLENIEKISEIKNDIVTIKRPLDDDFFTIQRLMYFCPDLYYISDNKIKSLVKEKLNLLKKSYEN